MADQKPMIKAFALWSNEGPKGKYLSGSLGGLKVLIFKNSYKKADKDPDYIAYFAEKEQESKGGGNNRQNASEDPWG